MFLLHYFIQIQLNSRVYAAYQIETLQTTTHSLEKIRGPVDDGVKDAVADVDPRNLPLFASDLARHVGTIEAIPRVVEARDELVLVFRPLWHSRDHGLVPGESMLRSSTFSISQKLDETRYSV